MKSEAKSGSKYSAPRLIVYGDMVKLTESGMGSVLEAGSPAASKKP